MQAWQIYLTALGGIAVLLLISLFGVAQTVTTVYTEQPYASAVVGEILGSASVGQTFIAEHNGLSRIELYLSTYARHNTGPLIFHLRTNLANNTDNNTDLITVTVDTGTVGDNAYQAFSFPPLRDSAGRHLYFFLEAPEATPGNAITVWGATGDVYPDGEAVFQGMESRGIQDLTFRIEYQPSLVERVGFLLDRLGANKPSLWGDRRLYLYLGVAYFVLLYIALLQAAQAARSSK